MHILASALTIMQSYARVIVLTNGAHCHEGLRVLVGLVWVDVVEGGRICRVLVASCEVYANCEIDLTSAHDIIQERK